MESCLACERLTSEPHNPGLLDIPGIACSPRKTPATDIGPLNEERSWLLDCPCDRVVFLVRKIGAGRFELPTSCSQSRRASQTAPRPAVRLGGRVGRNGAGQAGTANDGNAEESTASARICIENNSLALPRSHCNGLRLGRIEGSTAQISRFNRSAMRRPGRSRSSTSPSRSAPRRLGPRPLAGRAASTREWQGRQCPARPPLPQPPRCWLPP